MGPMKTATKRPRYSPTNDSHATMIITKHLYQNYKSLCIVYGQGARAFDFKHWGHEFESRSLPLKPETTFSGAEEGERDLRLLKWTI